MSLQLFANYENTLNNSIFYRLSSSNAYTATLSIKDTSKPGVQLTDLDYFGVYSLDGSLNLLNFDKNLTANIQFPSTGTHTIDVSAFNSTDFSLASTFSMSAIFVNSFPTATFVAYPSGFLTTNSVYVDGNTKIYHYYSLYTDDNYASDINAYLTNITNYSPNKGISFYGEGHTENIVLSSASVSPGNFAVWSIGSYQTTSSSTTAFIAVSSQPNTSLVLPIGVQICNNIFLSSGPTIQYSDIDGTASYYPFYASSVDLSGKENSSNTAFTGSLSVLKFPEPTAGAGGDIRLSLDPFDSASQDDTFKLPKDSSTQEFYSEVQWTNRYSPLVSYLEKTKWNLAATTSNNFVQPDWSVSLTNPNNSIYNSTDNFQKFNFLLSFYNQDDITNAYLKASLGNITQVCLTVSAISFLGVATDYQSVQTNIPTDWKPRIYTTVLTTTATINPLPVSNLYIPYYYVLTGTDVPITNSWINLYSYDLQPSQTVIYYPNKSPLTLSANQTGTLNFNSSDIGTIDLSAITTFYDIRLSAENLAVSTKTAKFQTAYTLSNQIEVLATLDDVEPHHYASEISPLVITHTKVPKLSPNEWVTSDNVNSLIDKLLVTLDELDQYSSLYKSSYKVIGRLEQYQDSGGDDINYILSGYSIPEHAFFSIDGKQLITYDSTVAIQNFPDLYPNEQIYVTSTSTLTSIVSGDSGFLPPYTVNYFITQPYTRYPSYTYKWIVANTDPLTFESWPSYKGTYPSYTGFAVLPQEPQHRIIASFSDKLVLLNNQYSTSAIDTQTSLDGIFDFVNIQAIGVTSKDFIIVLDSTALKISVFRILNDQFEVFTTWGQFGLKNSKQGFNKPQDIHIDQDDSIWIADTGNNCVKRFTINGKNILTITYSVLDQYAPLSVCVDSVKNVHILTSNGVYVFDINGNYLFEYSLPKDVSNAKKINTSYNREIIYITYPTGIVKFFRTGVIFEYILNNYTTKYNYTLNGFNTVFQDSYRNVYVTLNDQVVKIADIMKLERYKAPTDNLVWSSKQIYVDKEEYVQPWVYLKAFHRLWDNIEIFRNSLFYNGVGRRIYTPPTYDKKDLTIGQNELVMNSVINRLVNQLWVNIESIINFFDPNYTIPEIVIPEIITPENVIPLLSLPNLPIIPTRQYIDFKPIPSHTYGDSSFNALVSASSHLPVTLSSTSPTININGNTITILSAGTALISATQTGSQYFLSATPVIRKFTINKANQTIEPIKVVSEIAFRGPDVIFNIDTPLATSNLPVSLSVSSGPARLLKNDNTSYTITLTGAGTIVLAANQPGNSNYNSAPQVTANIKTVPNVNPNGIVSIIDYPNIFFTSIDGSYLLTIDQ